MSNPVDTIAEFAYHPLMERAQEALLKQLKKAEDALIENVRAKSEELKRKSQDHQFLGVQLYQLQQRIAKAQTLVENAYNNSQILIDGRLDADELLKNETNVLSEFQRVVDNCKVQQQKYVSELSAQSETIKKMEKYISEIQEEIAISKRVATKKELFIQQNEVQKENQDKYLDSLMDQLNRLGLELSALIGVTENRDNDIQEINGVLKEVEDEIKLILSEKSQLMAKWKVTLTGVGRRDEALQQASVTLTAAQNSLYDDDAIIGTIRRDILKEQRINETLVSLRDRLDNELQWVEENLGKTIIEVEQSREKYALLTKSLVKTDEEEKKIELLATLLNSESTALSLQLVIRERQKLEEELQLVQSNQANINKAVMNFNKEKSKTLQAAHQKENEAYTIENNIAVAKINKLNLQIIVDQLKDKNKIQINELKDKEGTITKYQSDVRQRNDEIEKKVYRVDRLNKKFERMIEMAGGAENFDSLENIVKRNQDTIESTLKEIAELERTWLSKQTDMVSVLSEIEKSTAKNAELKSRLSLLKQQKFRFETDQNNGKADIKLAQQQNVDLRKDTVKLNSLISLGMDQESQLQNANYTLETLHFDELKRLDDECIGLSSTVVDLKNAKSSLIDDIYELDRQILLWEKKLQLEKEMKEALDPLIGQDDVVNMEKDIHRMILRLEAIKKHQQTLSIEMENAVLKRETVSNRYGKSQKVSKSVSSATISSINKSITTANNELNLLQQKILQKQNEIVDQKNQLSEINTYANKLDIQLIESSDHFHQTKLALRKSAYVKQLLLESNKFCQVYLSQLKNYEREETLTKPQIDQKCETANNTAINIGLVINDLQRNFDHLSDVLSRIDDMTKIRFV